MHETHILETKNIGLYIWRGGGRVSKKVYCLYTHEKVDIFGWPLKYNLNLNLNIANNSADFMNTLFIILTLLNTQILPLFNYAKLLCSGDKIADVSKCLL